MASIRNKTLHEDKARGLRCVIENSQDDEHYGTPAAATLCYVHGLRVGGPFGRGCRPADGLPSPYRDGRRLLGRRCPGVGGSASGRLSKHPRQPQGITTFKNQ